MPLPRSVPLILAFAIGAALPSSAQIFADFDAGTSSSPEIPGPLSFSVYLDSTTGLSDTANADRLVANFIRLAEGEDEWIDSTTGQMRKEPFFDGLEFYKLSYNDRIYFGSRTGDGTDDPGWVVQDDFRSDVTPFWALYMDNDGPNTNGCRYFISRWDDPTLAGKYPRMGYVLQNSPAFPAPNNGPSRIFTISTGPTDSNGFATDPQPINSVTIRRVGNLAENFDEDAMNLPEVSASGFHIIRHESGYRLLWSEQAGTVVRYFGSPDLINWFPFDDYDPPGTTVLGTDITNDVATGLPGFYRGGGAIHYPEWPAHELDLEDAALQFEWLDNNTLWNYRLVLTFGSNGTSGTWAKYYDLPGPGTFWNLEGSGAHSAAWSSIKPFVGELALTISTGTLPNYTLRLHFDYRLPTMPGNDRFVGFTTIPPFEAFEGEWNYTPLAP